MPNAKGNSGKKPKLYQETEKKPLEKPGSVSAAVILWPMNEPYMIMIQAAL